MGNGRTKGPDEVFCRSCGDPIKRRAELCPHCGVRNRENTAGTSAGERLQRSPPTAPAGMFDDAFSYPNRGRGSGRTLIVGTGLSLFWFLVFPIVLLQGYFVRVLGATARGEPVPPSFDDWGRMAVDGVLGLVIVTVLYAIPLVVFALLGGIQPLVAGSDLASGALAVAVVATALLYVPFTYLYPAVLTGYAMDRSLSDAFDVDRIVAVAKSGSYVGAWFVGFLINVAVFVGLFVFSLIPFVGLFAILLWPTLGFYGGLAAHRSFGLAYRRADDGAAGTAT